MRAQEVMTRRVQVVSEDTPLRDCMKRMTENHISGLPVMHGEMLVGILTEGDILRQLRNQVPWYAALAMGSPVTFEVPPESLDEVIGELYARPAGELMTHHVVSVSSQTDLQDVAQVMMNRRLKRLPVVDQGKLVGIISRGDVIRGML